jgi:hypothetical protein
MKKAANLVDKALEVARKVRSVPKKPVKTKGKKTVPEALDWGPGIPLDKLAYLNDEEMALVQAKRMFKDKRNYKGVPAFPDPGDTAAGDTGQGTSSSGGLNDGGGSTYGGGGGSDSGAGGDGGMGSYGGGDSGAGGGTGGGSDSGGGTSGGVGGGTGGGSDSGTGGTSGGGSDSGAGGTDSTGGTSTSGGTGTSSTSGTSPSGSTGPTSGSLSQPARTEASSYSATSAPTPPSGYQSYGGYNPVSSAPSSMASEAAMDRIASGSSVIGNTTPQGYAEPKIQDSVAPVSYSQTPTVSLSNLADPSLQEAADKSFATSNTWKGLSGYGSLNTPQETAMSQPSVSTSPAATQAADGYMPSDMRGTTRSFGTLSGPNQGLGYSPTAPGSVSTTPAAAQVDNSYSPTTVSTSAYAQPELNEAAQNYAFNNPTARWGDFSNYGAVRSTPQTEAVMVANQPVMESGASTPPAAAVSPTNPFYSSPAEQAADIRRSVALAQGPARAPTVINIPGGDIPVGTTQPTGVVPASADEAAPVVSPDDQYAYDPAQDPANYMRPIYPGDEDGPSYLSPERRADYLNDLGGTRSSERPPPQAVQPPRKEEVPQEEEKKRKRRPRPKDDKYVYRDYMYNEYGPVGARPDADIVAFNRFNKRNFNKGGRIGDSVDAALRIAKSKLL